MQVKIKQLCDQLSNATIENEKLQFKLIEISENVVCKKVCNSVEDGLFEHLRDMHEPQ